MIKTGLRLLYAFERARGGLLWGNQLVLLGTAPEYQPLRGGRVAGRGAVMQARHSCSSHGYTPRCTKFGAWREPSNQPSKGLPRPPAASGPPGPAAAQAPPPPPAHLVAARGGWWWLATAGRRWRPGDVRSASPSLAGWLAAAAPSLPAAAAHCTAPLSPREGRQASDDALELLGICQAVCDDVERGLRSCRWGRGGVEGL